MPIHLRRNTALFARLVLQERCHLTFGMNFLHPSGLRTWRGLEIEAATRDRCGMDGLKLGRDVFEARVGYSSRSSTPS